MKAHFFTLLCASLLAAFLISPVHAQINLPNISIYGPAGNHYLDYSKVVYIIVPPGKTLDLVFECGAVHENAMVMYEYNTGKRLIERGNYNRSLQRYVWRNKYSSPVTLYFTGWNKSGQPNGALPWRQSPYKLFSSQGTYGEFGFEDLPGTYLANYRDFYVKWRIY